MTTTHPQGTRGGAGQGLPAGEPAAAGAPGASRPGERPGPGPDGRPQRPLALTGAIAACAAAGAGLATLTLVAAIAWIAAVHIGLGAGLPGVLRTAIQLWLVGHHVGFVLHSAGKIGLLPLGLVLVPGALLWRAGRWVARSGGVRRLRHVGYAALALAVPYGLLAGALAVASRTTASAPSPVQAAVAGFLLAFVAGGLGGARALAPWARLIGLLPDRVRCLVVGVTGSLAVLAGAGALLTGGSLIAHAHDFRLASDALSPGLPGAALLLLAALGYLPNAIIWAMAYMLGPGFAFGVGTIVAPTGTLLGPLPVFPMLTALPTGSLGPHPVPAPWTGLAVLAVPYLAGVFGGLLTVRTAPTPTVEAAPLWGFASGVLTGGVVGLLAAFSGGSLGTGRLSATGPVAWQVGAVAALELGVAAAISAGLANWLLLRRVSAASAAAIMPDAGDPADEGTAGDGTVDDLARDGTVDDLPDDVDEAGLTNDDGVERVTLLSPVTAEDLASLAESPGTDTPVLPALPAGDDGEFGYLPEAPEIAADEFGYLPEPPGIADDLDDEPDGPPQAPDARGGTRHAGAREATDQATPPLPPALAALTRLATPAHPVADPADDTEPADEAEPVDDAELADDTGADDNAETADGAQPADGAGPPDDAESADDAEPAEDALGHVIYLRPRGAGSGDDAVCAAEPDSGHDPDGDATDDAGDDPVREPGADGSTGHDRPAAPGLPLS